MKIKIKIIIVFLFLINMLVFDNVKINKIVEDGKLTASFGESRSDHFHTGIDIGGSEKNIYSLTDGQLIFHNVKRKNSISYGYGNFLIIEDKNNLLRINYSHIKDNSYNTSKINYKKNDIIAITGNTGHSAGDHLHIEIHDIKNKAIVNPLNFIDVSDDIPPRLLSLYFIDYHNEKINLLEKNHIRRGGNLFIECIDSVNSSGYTMSPYNIKVYIDGIEKLNLIFDKFVKESNDIILNNRYHFNDLYVNKIDNNYFLMEYYSLPDVIGLKIEIIDYKGNKNVFKRPLRIVLPETSHD